MNTRTEHDAIGDKEIPINSLWGINTSRALENFKVSDRKTDPVFIKSYAEVKLACANVNFRLNYLEKHIYEAVQKACLEMRNNQLDEFIVISPYQGGAGTSTNLNICEVIANRALQILGQPLGTYEICDPFLHVNLHQSTNDTYPTAVKMASLYRLKELETAIVKLQEAVQAKEKEFADFIKIGRTELMDAVPMTLGRMFGAWADALSRDRWRIFKSSERLRVINLGGTAIGTGLGAPRAYIFQVVEELRTITGLPLARSENLMDATQNTDVFVECMGMLKAHAMNLMKISSDLRLLNMGPDCGLAEIRLPELQAGSSIMPGKINPVIPEMMQQICMQVAGFDQAITWACGSGQLELNAFLPLICLNILESLTLLTAANQLAADKCISGISADAEKCRRFSRQSAAIATVMVPKVGYHKAAEIAALIKQGMPFEKAASKISGLSEEVCAELLTPQSINALGF